MTIQLNALVPQCVDWGKMNALLDASVKRLNRRQASCLLSIVQTIQAKLIVHQERLTEIQERETNVIRLENHRRESSLRSTFACCLSFAVIGITVFIGGSRFATSELIQRALRRDRHYLMVIGRKARIREENQIEQSI